MTDETSPTARLSPYFLRSIEATFQKRAAVNLLGSRGGRLPTKDETPTADAGDWELVTWLVVQEPKS